MSILADGDIAAIAGAMAGVLKQGAAEVVAYAEQESASFARSIEDIAKLYSAGAIGADEAKAQLDLQKSASQTVFTAIAGITELIADQAIAAGLAVVAGVVNKAVGFVLL